MLQPSCLRTLLDRLRAHSGPPGASRAVRAERIEALEQRIAPASFVVTTTADSGAGSLRQALLDATANGTVDPDTISFAIPGGGVQTIHPLTPLPGVSASVLIDGYTQPGATANSLGIGSNASLLIQLSGDLTADTTSDNGLLLAGGGSTVRGLIINNFHAYGISIVGGGNNTVSGNWIGTNSDGLTGVFESTFGILISGSGNNLIGGATPAARNVVASNVESLEIIGAGSGNVVQGNYFGLGKDGTTPLGNRFALYTQSPSTQIGGPNPGEGNVIANTVLDAGIFVNTTTAANTRIEGNLIGTDATGAVAMGNGNYGIIADPAGVVIRGNVISGNADGGINIAGNNATIQGNLIGTDKTGTAAVPNLGPGITIEFPSGTGVSTGTIGGLVTGDGNRIAFNKAAGIYLSGNVTGISILGNSIEANNGFGIQLAGGGAPNDALDTDSGPNGLLNSPKLGAANQNSGTLSLSGAYHGAANTTVNIEFFYTAGTTPGLSQGAVYVGSQTVTTDGAGNATINFTQNGSTFSAGYFTATATQQSDKSTSEFSSPVPVAQAGGDFFWNGSVSSNWFDAANWSPNAVPGSADTVHLSGGSVPFQPVLTTDATVGVFEQSGGSLGGAGKLTVLQQFLWSGGTESGNGTTAVLGGSFLSGSAMKFIDGRNVSFGASSLWIGQGEISLASNGSLASSSVFEIQNGLHIRAGAGGGTFKNSGTLLKNSADTTTFEPGVRFENSASLEIAQGQLEFQGAAFSNSSATIGITIAPGAGLVVSNGTFTLSGGHLVQGGGTLFVNGGTLDLGATAALTVNAVSTLELDNGSIKGSGSLTANGPVSWGGGTFSGSGTSEFNGEFSIFGNTAHLLDQRTLTLKAGASHTGNGGFQIDNGGQLVIEGLFSEQATSGFSHTNGAAGSIVINPGGVLQKSGPASIVVLGPGVALTNSGELRLQSGVLGLNGGGSGTSGTYTVSSGASLDFVAGTFTLQGSTVFGGGGQITVPNGTLDILGSTEIRDSGTNLSTNGTVHIGATTTVQAGATLSLNGGTLDGASQLAVNGTLAWKGGTMGGTGTVAVGSLGSVLVSGPGPKVLDGRTITNQGQITLSGSDVAFNRGAINTTGLGFFDFDGDVRLVDLDGSGTLASFSNNGTVRKLSGTGNGGFGPGMLVENYNAFESDAGTFTLSNYFSQYSGSIVLNGGDFAAGFFDLRGGTLSGSGKLVGDVGNTFITVQPGGAGTVGTLKITGNYTQTFGTLAIDIGGTTPGTGYDQLIVLGALDLKGRLNVATTGGFAPVTGTNFSVLTGSSRTGDFTTFNATGFLKGLPGSDVVLTAGSLSVSNASDSGAGSLRDAIVSANAHFGSDTITFAIPGTGVQTISLLSGLPMLTETVDLNATTQPGYTLAPLIELSGASAGANTDGLVIAPGAAGSSVRGFVINGFSGNGVVIKGGSSYVVGNYIGLNAAGTAAVTNGGHGIALLGGTSNNTIGGYYASDTNVISGNSQFGISVEGASNGNSILGNAIGTDASGLLAVANAAGGIQVRGSDSNVIGASSPGAGNVIAGNGGPGIVADTVSSLQIQGNFIGVGADGTTPLGNTSHGIVLTGSLNGVIGGVNAGEANVIANNSGAGVRVASGSGNSIRGNSFHSNSALGIDLVGGTENTDNVTANDPLDADSGANGLQNFPSILSAIRSGSSSSISGSFQGAPSSTLTVDFYSNTAPDPSGFGEGRTYLGSATVNTDSSGTGTFNFTTGTLAAGLALTATATDGSGNTSEFSTAQTLSSVFIWDGGGGTDQSWNNPLNWNFDNGVPGALDTAILDTSATILLNAGNVTVTSFLQSAGTLGGGSDLTVIGSFDWSGGTLNGSGAFNIDTSALFSISGSSIKTLNQRSLNLAGTGTWSDTGAINLGQGGAFNIQSGGVLDLQSDATFGSSGLSPAGSFSNAGTLRKSAGSATSTIDFGGTTLNSGLLEVKTGQLLFNPGNPLSNSGTIDIASGATLSVMEAFTQTAGVTQVNGHLDKGSLSGPLTFAYQGGELRGSGTITGNVSSTGAAVSPGGAGAAGILVINGSYTQGAGATLAVDLGGTTPGTEYDQLQVVGTAVLDGTLSVTNINGFVPVAGQTFNVVVNSSLSGQFASLSGDTRGLSQQIQAGGLDLVRNGLIYIWDGDAGTDTSWFNPLNWDLDNGFPGEGDTAILDIEATITLPSNASVGTLAQSAGSVFGPGDLTISKAFNWSGGSMKGGGTTIMSPGSTGYFAVSTILSGRDMSIGGDFSALGNTFVVISNATLTVEAGGSLGLISNANSFTTESGGALLNILGTLFQDTTLSPFGGLSSFTGGSSIEVPTTVGATGLVEVDNGTLTVTDTFDNGGLAHAIAGALVISGGGTSSGTFTADGISEVHFSAGTQLLTTGAALSGTGLFLIDGGSLGVDSGVTVSPGRLALSSGSLGGAGKTSVTQSLDWTGGTMDGGGTTVVANGAVGTFKGSGDKFLLSRTLEIAGTANWQDSGGLNLQSSTLRVLSGGLFDIQNDATFSAGSSTLEVSGSMIKSAGTGTTIIGAMPANVSGLSILSCSVLAGGSMTVQSGTLDIQTILANAGTVDVQAGTLSFVNFNQSAGSLKLTGGSVESSDQLTINGGELSGAGTISANVSNTGGTVRPGGTGAAGLLSITGDYTQGTGGTLAVELGGLTAGSGYDQFGVGGSATVAGVIDERLINGFTPSLNDRFTILTRSASGIDAATLSGDIPAIFSIESNAADIQLVVTTTPPPPVLVDISNASAAEGQSGTSFVVFTVRLDQASTVPVSVHFATHDLTQPGAATAGIDYDLTEGDLTFAPGEQVKTISVPIRGDTNPEGRERFGLTLSGVTGAALGTSEALGFILDDDHNQFFTSKALGSQVEIRQGSGARLVGKFAPFAPAYTGGVRIASGDVNGDGVNDLIAGAGVGGGARIRVYDGANVDTNGRPLRLLDFPAFENAYRGGVYVAAGDVDGDGKADIIVAPSAGSNGIVRVFNGDTGQVISSFSPFGRGLGGLRVAAGDVDGDGRADVIVAGGVGSFVRVFDGLTGSVLDGTATNFRSLPRSYEGSISITSGDINGDGLDDIIVGAETDSSVVRVYYSGLPLTDFSQFSTSSSLKGVRVGAADINADGIADIITSQARNGSPRVRVFSGATVASGSPSGVVAFDAFSSDLAGGVFVA